ncbi:MAG: hypothetical protein KBT29_02275 [Prevotellaceae bacterium]|nr:hypothetical protein [Candidatus Minthosoma caballi]
MNKAEQAELDSLRNVVESQQDELDMANSFVLLYNTSVDSLLNSNDVIFEPGESVVMTKDKIKGRIDAVNALLDKQRSKVQELQKLLEKNNSEHAKQLKEALARMQAQLDAKDAEIRDLKAKIDAKNINIAELKSNIQKMESNISNLEQQTKQQEDALVAQNELLNTGYVAIGTSKELKAKGLMSGGFLSKKKVNVSGVDESKFNKVDMRTYKSVVIPAKKAQVLTPMPADSYTIAKNADNTCTLTITDVGRFWSQTTFLIISY